MTTMPPPTRKTTRPAAEPTRTQVLVVVVNYRTAGLVCDCLDSLLTESSRVPGMRVVVTDNASGDGSAEQIAEHITAKMYDAWASVMPLETNGGFAYGNNAALQQALASDNPPAYLMLLNPDTVIREGAVESLCRFMDDHPAVGIAGSRLEDPDSTVQPSAFRFPGVAGEFEEAVRFGPVSRLLKRWVVAPEMPTAAQSCDWVSGASMIVRRAVFDDVGLLDAGYFMYYEELDFIRRAADAGWACWYVPESRVIHLVGQASGVTDLKKPLKRRPAYWFVSRSRYFLRHHGFAGKLLIDVGWLSGRVLFKAMNLVRRKPTNDPPYLVRDYIRHNLLPARKREGGATS